MSNLIVENNNLSLAWLEALNTCLNSNGGEVAPLIVSINKFDENNLYYEDKEIREMLNLWLEDESCQKVETVANTIFPVNMWNENKPRSDLFSRYNNIFQKIQKSSSKNKFGVYFDRMITGGPVSDKYDRSNQLEFIIDNFTSRDSVKRSSLQLGIFQPDKDHTSAALRGFPCLQHITFTPNGKNNESLNVNAFYAGQYIMQKAYGNYVGLCNLGRFVASETGKKLARVTCYIGLADLEFSKKKVKCFKEFMSEENS